MHSINQEGKAIRKETDPIKIQKSIFPFFERRLEELHKQGIDSARCILDPGMGFFLGANPETSFYVLENIYKLKEKFKLPLLICVSRKSFLGNTIQAEVHERNAATLAAELYSVLQGVSFIRTHEPKNLLDATTIWKNLC